MIKGLSAVSILPFYRDVLGLKVSIQSPRFDVLGSPGAPTIGLGTHREIRGRNADPARHMVGLAPDDLVADWGRLTAAGVVARGGDLLIGAYNVLDLVPKGRDEGDDVVDRAQRYRPPEGSGSGCGPEEDHAR